MIELSRPYPIFAYVIIALVLLAAVIVARRIAISRQLRKWWLFVPRVLLLGGLLAILLNPVRLSENQLPPRSTNVIYLIDCSRSMALDQPTSRIDHVKQAIYSADQRVLDKPRVHMYRFGQDLSAVASVPQLLAVDQSTEMQRALRVLPTRFEREAPKAVVVFSDGMVQDKSELAEIAEGFREMNVPVHVFPVSNQNIRGDVAIEQLVVPRRVEPGTKVPVQATIRNTGFENERVVVQIRSAQKTKLPPLASLPITLEKGVQTCELVVEINARQGPLLIEATPLEGEAIKENNRVPFRIAAGDKKIKVLYMEGTPGTEYHWIQDALTADPDIECLSMVVNSQYAARPRLARVNDSLRGFPTTREELFEYDVVICSDISQGAFTREQLEWTVELVEKRGGGFVMIGGHTSFGSGNWDQTSWDKLIPMDMTGGTIGQGYINSSFQVKVPDEQTDHPIWRIMEDPVKNKFALSKMPRFYGTNLIKRVKPAATLLGLSATRLSNVGNMPVFACESYGRGRTFALSSDSTMAWGRDFEARWGENDNRYFRKFWRNVIRWLCENSFSGSKRLHVETDKIIYRPGEPITITATAFDETLNATTDYTVSAELTFVSDVEGRVSQGNRLILPANTVLNRYNGEITAALPPVSAGKTDEFSTLHPAQIDFLVLDKNVEIERFSLDVQVLEDSRELLTPWPDHETLKILANKSGGRILEGEQDLSEVLSEHPSTPGEVIIHKSPLWDHPGFWCILLALLGVEWALRRRFGLDKK